MKDGGPITQVELPQRTNTSESYAPEWLLNQATNSYVKYDSAIQRYMLPDEQAMALTDETSPFFLCARVADIECGHGASTTIMARAFPASRFTRYDNHALSIEYVWGAAAQAGLVGRVSFPVADATSCSGQGYELIAFFDAFRDLGNPAGAARHAREALAPGGSLMLVEPMAGERVEQNFSPVGRVFSGLAVLCCSPKLWLHATVTSPLAPSLLNGRPETLSCAPASRPFGGLPRLQTTASSPPGRDAAVNAAPQVDPERTSQAFQGPPGTRFRRNQ